MSGTGAFPINAPPGIIGGQRRELHLVFALDKSYSMKGQRIQQLNYAMRALKEPLRDAASKNPQAQMFVRALAFSSGAQWINPHATSAEDFQWTDLEPDGETHMGRAMEMVADEMASIAARTRRMLPPVIVLVSDGGPTDDFLAGLNKLVATKPGRDAVRVAIAIGDDAKLRPLEQFINNDEIKPLRAHNAEDLVNYIRWASITVVNSVLVPALQAAPGAGVSAPIAGGGTIVIPKPPPNAPGVQVF